MGYPEFFQTGMGKKFYERTMPQLVTTLAVIAGEMKKENDFTFTAENIVKHASDDELFSLFHRFKEYYNRFVEKEDRLMAQFNPLDCEIGEIVKQLKKTERTLIP